MSRNFLSVRPPALLVLALCFALAPTGWAAEGGKTPKPSSPAPSNLEPVFPVENPNLVFIEAEDAVSTNFAREAVLNYSCSGARTLQLNRSTGLEGVGSFYADYVFTVPSDGTWELWYGGTPPGPREELYPSFTSPFQLTIDDEKPRQVYREDMTVVENYTPSYYWNLIGDLTLEARSHRIRFEVTERRKIDGRYYFFFDCYFLVKKEDGKRLLAEPLPAVFPKNMEERRINLLFASIDDSLIQVRDNPGKTQPLVDLSLIYTLLGDYLNAIKYLNRAAIIAPEDAGIALLTAKNRIWKGDVAEGLKKYSELLARDPKRRDIWLEAGKVAGWTGRYDDSIKLYRDGLAVFPRDPDLTINLGLTYLWASRGQEAENVFRDAQALAGSEAAKLKDMGRVYRVNGYPDRAVQAFNAAIAAAPRDLEAYLLVIDTLQGMGKRVEAEAAEKRIADTFASSPRLSAFLENFRAREGLKDAVMEEYRKKLEENPNNLVLRQVLAQTYFWNGLKGRAIEAYRNILENHAYLAVRNMETGSTELLNAIDARYIVLDYFSRVPALVQKQRGLLSAQLGKLATAQATRDAAAKSLESAKAAQAKAKPGKDADKALEAMHAAEDKLLAAENAILKETSALSALLARTNALLEQYEERKKAEAAGSETVDALRQKDAAAEELFAQATKANRWKFDRSGALAEMGKDAKTNALARFVMAKIYLMDKLTVEAQALLAGHFADPGVGIGTRFTIAESWLWAGKVKEASPIITALVENPENLLVPPYFADLKTLIASLQEVPAPGEATAESADPAAEAKGVAQRLAAMEKDAPVQGAAVQKTLGLLHTLYRHGLVRAYYAFEEKTYNIRNELGDYYLAEEPPALDEAIAQFLRVLAVDPGDLSATFRLGKVYLWKRDWKSALDSFQSVYRADQYYENVAAQYNQVSREHPNSIITLGSYFADTQRAQWHAEAVYLQRFNTVLGMSASYQTDVVRFQQWDPYTALTDHSSYQLHDISLGVPIDLFEANVTLTPWVGGMLRTNGLYNKTQSGGTVSPAFIEDQFEAFAAEPYVKLDSTLGVGSALFLNSTLRWGRQPDTFDPARKTAVYDASAELNVTTLLSFIDIWPLRDTSIRTYGRVDLLHTPEFSFTNLLYTGLLEISSNVVKGGSPYRVISVGGNVTYENSANVESYLYYAPNGVLLAGGTLAASVWFGVGGGDVMGVSARGYAGSYQELVLSASPIQRFKWEAEADVSLTQGNATYTLSAIANSTFRYDQAAWDYWSAYVRLGCSVKLPTLLVP